MKNDESWDLTIEERLEMYTEYGPYLKEHVQFARTTGPFGQNPQIAELTGYIWETEQEVVAQCQLDRAYRGMDGTIMIPAWDRRVLSREEIGRK